MTQVKIYVYQRALAGTETEIFNVTSTEINNLTVALKTVTHTETGATAVAVTDRLVVKIYHLTDSASSKTTTLYLEGAVNQSRVLAPFDIPIGNANMFKAVYDPNGDGVIAGSGSGHIIQNETTPLTARANLNFAGAGVTAADDGGNDATLVTIPGGSSIWFNVVDYGAAGNGTSDDTDAVQDALDAAAVNGGVAYFPAGTYLCNTLTPYRNVSIIGEGRDLSIIKSAAAETLFAYATGTSFGTFLGVIADIKLDGDDTGTIGIDILAGLNPNIQRCAIYNFTSIGIKLRAVLIGEIKDCKIVECATGIDADSATLGDVGYVQANLLRIENCTFNGCVTWGIHWVHGSMLLLENCDMEWCGTDANAATGGIYYKPVFEGLGMVITENWFEHNFGGADVLIDDPEEAGQLCAIDNSLFVMTGTTTYGIRLNGSSVANALACRNVVFYTDLTYDFYAYGAHAIIYLAHCVGTYGGTGTISVDGSGPGQTWMEDPTLVNGDMIYRHGGAGITNQATAALGASATAVSAAGGHAASLLIDVNDTTYWTASGYPVTGQWVKIDLGSQKNTAGYRLYQFGTASTDEATAMTIYGSNDDVNYTKIMDATINIDTGANETIENFPSTVSYRYYRFVATSGGVSGWAIFTIEIYDLPPASMIDRLPIGTDDQVLTVVDGIPGWADAAGGALADHDHSGDAGDGGTFDAANLTSAAATDGYVLTADGSGGAAWETPTAGSGDVGTDTIWDVKGDLAVGTGANTAARLPAGTNGKYLKADSGQTTGLIWDTPAGAGDVVGPAASTDEHLAVWNGTDSKTLKDGGAVPAGVTNLAAASLTRTAGSYTTTSATFVDVDATNVKLTITTGARRVLITVTAECYHSVANAFIYFDVDLDGTRISGQANGIMHIRDHVGDWGAVSFSWLTDALSAGSHTFKLQWRTSQATANLYGAGSAWPLRFSVVELYAG